MPELTKSYHLALQLRRILLLHRPARWDRRTVLKRIRDVALEAARLVAPANPRIGAPKGTFSIYEGLREGRPDVKGRIIQTEQVGQRVPKTRFKLSAG